MTDDRVLQSLQQLRGPVEPDAGFSDGLFTRLAAEVDFDRGAPLGRWGRVQPVLRSRPSQRGLVSLLVAALLVLGVLCALAVAGRQPPSQELIRRSHAVDAASAPFDITVRMPSTTIRYRYAGRSVLRGDVVAADSTAPRPAGSHFLFDGVSFDEYGTDGTFIGTYAVAGPGGSPQGALPYVITENVTDVRSSPLAAYPLTWTVPGTFRTPPVTAPCTQLDADEGVTTVAGRAVDALRCHPLLRVWLDASTGRMLKVDWGGGNVAEATAADLQPTLQPGLFDPYLTSDGLRPLGTGHIAPGTYDAAPFEPDLTVRIDDGWFVNWVSSQVVNVQRGDDVSAVTRPDTLVDPTTGRAVAFTGDAAAFVAWLRGHSSLATTPPAAITVPGGTGFRLMVSTRPDAAVVPCTNDVGANCVQLTKVEGIGYGEVIQGWPHDMVVLEVHGRLVVITTVNVHGGIPTTDPMSILSFP